MREFFDEKLEYERFIAELLRLRKSPEHDRWYKSPYVTATLTTVLTVIVTSVGSYKIQQLARAQDTFMQRQQELFRRKQELAVQTFDLFALIMKANADRLLLATGYLDEFPEAQRDSLLLRSNEADDRWRLQRDNVTLLVHVYFGGESATTMAWDSARGSLNAYGECIENAYLSAQRRRARHDVCANEKGVAERAAMVWRDRARDALQREFSRREW